MISLFRNFHIKIHHKTKTDILLRCRSFDINLSAVEEDLAAIVFRTHGEVDPIGSTPLLLDEFIQFPMVLISRIKQDAGIAYHLLWTSAANVHCTTR